MFKNFIFIKKKNFKKKISVTELCLKKCFLIIHRERSLSVMLEIFHGYLKFLASETF